MNVNDVLHPVTSGLLLATKLTPGFEMSNEYYPNIAGTHSATKQDLTSPEPFPEVPDEPQISQVLNGQAAFMATTAIYCTVCVISIIGIGINIVNVIVFLRLGMNKDTMNIGLGALSVADLLTLITLLLLGVVNTPLYRALEIPMAPYDATLLLTGPFMAASVTSHCITALISFERCVCVVKPFQVKSIVTVNRVRAAVICIFAVTMLGTVPKYATTNLSWREVPGENRTLLRFEYTPLMRQVEEVTIQILNVFIPFITYLLVVVFTVILVSKLRQALIWRANFKRTLSSPPQESRSDSGLATISTIGFNRCTSTQEKSDSSQNSLEEVSTDSVCIQPGTASGKMEVDLCREGQETEPTVVVKSLDEKQPDLEENAGRYPKYTVRELRVLKSVILICVIFLTCTSPTVILITIYLSWPKFHVDTPEFENLMHLLISFPFLTQAVSSSINIVFYLRMSSKFRPVCTSLFHQCCPKRRPSP